MKWLRHLTLLLVLCLLLPTVALADLQRGDRSEDVRWLQELLIGTGWLFEEADGVFGRNTEEAVMNYQSFKGLTPTGIADDALIGMLTNDKSYLDYQITIGNFYSEGAGADGRRVEDYCYTTTLSYPGHQSTEITYCEAHARLLAQAEELMTNDDPAAAARLYEEEIAHLYSQWWQQVYGNESIDALKAATGAFTQSLDAHTDLLTLWYGPAATLAPQSKRAELLRAHMVFLCEIVNMQNQGGEN